MICLAFAVNGGGINIIGGSYIFHSTFLHILKILPVFVQLELLKILKNLFEENSPIMTPEISHILLTYSNFIFLLYLPILKVSCVWLEWLKRLNFEEPHFDAPNFVKFDHSFVFACVAETVMCLA